MRILDITGPIFDGMWTYGPPYPEVVVEEIAQPTFVKHATYSWRFELGAQTGTYLETSLHVDHSGPELITVPVQRLVNFAAAVIRVEVQPLEPITREQLIAGAPEIRPGDAIIVASGWSRKWQDEDYVANCPYFEAAAMNWILDHEPWLMGGDMPRFDSWTYPQGFWDRFFGQGTLLLGPLWGLEQIQGSRGSVTALPLKVTETCAAPCRVIFMEE